MSSSGRVVDPIVRTYIRKDEKIHVRIYSRRYDLDRRGTGATVEEARRRILAHLPEARPRR